jgi:hypothetical protein
MAIVIVAGLLGIWRFRSPEYFKWLAILFVWMLAGTLLFSGGGTLQDPTGDGLITRQIRIATNDGPGMGIFAIIFIIVYWGGAIFFVSRMVKAARRYKADQEAALDHPDYREEPDNGGRKTAETVALLFASAAWIYYAFILPRQAAIAPSPVAQDSTASGSANDLPPQIERDLVGAAAQVNAETPKQVDATTTLERASASGKTFTYYYSITERGTAKQLRSFVLKNVVPKVCGGPLRAAMKSDGVSYVYSYKLPNLTEPVAVEVTEEMCSRAGT